MHRRLAPTGWTLALVATICTVVAGCALVGGGCVCQVTEAVSTYVGYAGNDMKNEGCGAGSGIEGQISFGPISPLARPGMLNYRPYQATIDVLDEKKQVVAQVQSDADGQFRVCLAPGRYILDPQSHGSRPRAAKQVITLRVGEVTKIRINYDSGIR